MSLLEHAVVRQVATFLDSSGVEAWLVGGVVRDALLGRALHDLDFAVAGDGLALARRLADRFGAAFVALDAERQVGRVVLDHEGEKLFVDLAALRGAAGIEDDLWLRDFTVNAMALEVLGGRFLDPTNGAADVESRTIRAVSAQVFHDDPLRMLRAVRQAGQLDFVIEPATQALIEQEAHQIVRPAGERVREELLALLAQPGAATRVRQLDTLRLLPHLLPELATGKGVTQSPPHIYDVFDHNLAVLDVIEHLLPPSANLPLSPISNLSPTPPLYALRSTLYAPGAPLTPWHDRLEHHLAVHVGHEQPRWLLLKLAALLHDIGKPSTRTVGDDGRIHFYEHEPVGARMVESLLRRLKMSAGSIAWVSRIVATHLRPLHLSAHLPPRRRTLFRYFQATGATGPDVALLSLADQRGKGFPEDRAEVVEVARHILAGYFDERETLVTVRPLLDGDEIMAATGIGRGPRVGQLLARLREAQASGHVKDRDAALKYILDLTTH